MVAKETILLDSKDKYFFLYWEKVNFYYKDIKASQKCMWTFRFINWIIHIFQIIYI